MLGRGSDMAAHTAGAAEAFCAREGGSGVHLPSRASACSVRLSPSIQGRPCLLAGRPASRGDAERKGNGVEDDAGAVGACAQGVCWDVVIGACVSTLVRLDRARLRFKRCVCLHAPLRRRAGARAAERGGSRQEPACG